MAVSGFDLFGGGGVKSIQNGVVELTQGQSVLDVPIEGVDFNKSIVVINNIAYSANVGVNELLTHGYLKDKNTVRLQRSSSLSTVVVTVSYQVIEFSSVKSLQRGITEKTTTDIVDIPIEMVDPKKTFISYSRSTNQTTGQSYLSTFTSGAYLLDAMTLRLAGSFRAFFAWEIVEFE